MPPSGWNIKWGYLWCPKSCRGFTRRALRLHIRGCPNCPLNANRQALADIQTWSAPDADRSVLCTCGTTVTRTEQYGLWKVLNRHLKNAKFHRGTDPKTQADALLSETWKTVSTSRRTAISTGPERVVSKAAATHAAADPEVQSEQSNAAAPAPTVPTTQPSRPEPARQRYVSHAERVLASSIERIGAYNVNMTVKIMPGNMSQATRRSYRYHLRNLLLRAGLLSADEGLESFDFRYLLGSPEKIGRVREVLETVNREHTATAYLMFCATKHVLGIIPGRVFLLGDDLGMEWTSLCNIVSQTLKGEEGNVRASIRSRRVKRAAERQAELQTDIGSRHRAPCRRPSARA